MAVPAAPETFTISAPGELIATFLFVVIVWFMPEAKFTVPPAVGLICTDPAPVETSIDPAPARVKLELLCMTMSLAVPALLCIVPVLVKTPPFSLMVSVPVLLDKVTPFTAIAPVLVTVVLPPRLKVLGELAWLKVIPAPPPSWKA